MRGSPLLRTLTVLLLLAATAWGLACVTHRGETAPPAATTSAPETPKAAEGIQAHYQLTLSAEAAKVELESAGKVRTEQNGVLTLDPANPTLFLRIAWTSSSAPGHRFAKLVLDLPGRDSQTHVFEAPGDIDDVWEITP